ncbi:MAG: M20/M25/M40 family metallo-hydrolase, partial [Candidatus Poribacteria bacterium]|nr:M20/M25/M40 family metallo-hydrolase [Candidatus Poribacteria bacterium]
VNIPSPTGETVAVTERYADYYRAAGLDVTLMNPVPNAPNMAAYLRGGRGGRTLQYDGHADVIALVETDEDGARRVVPVPHPPPKIADGVLTGRGAADMKGGLAIMAETARVFAEVGFPFDGALLFTTHGWHEAPVGFGQGIQALIRDGHVGDAALVAEGAHDFIPIAGRGMAIYNATISRDGEVLHENATPEGTPHPLFALGRLVGRIEALRGELAKRTHELVQPETVFVGQTHGGDFYNRYANIATVQGTRRWHPGRTFEAIRDEFGALVDKVAAETGCSIEVAWQLVRPSYVVAADDPIVDAARFAFRQVKGVEPRIGGFASVGDAATLTAEGGVPSLWFGPNAPGPHSNLESIALDEMVDRTRMFLAAAVGYFSEES